ncbi:hypothetical protein ACX9MO_10045 [Pseudooceanicola sp. 502str34]
MHDTIDWEKEVRDTRSAATAAARGTERVIAGVAETLSLLRDQQTSAKDIKSELSRIIANLGELETTIQGTRHLLAKHQVPANASAGRLRPLLWAMCSAFVGALFAVFFVS